MRSASGFLLSAGDIVRGSQALRSRRAGIEAQQLARVSPSDLLSAWITTLDEVELEQGRGDGLERRAGAEEHALGGDRGRQVAEAVAGAGDLEIEIGAAERAVFGE